jgi:hypothetical protein
MTFFYADFLHLFSFILNLSRPKPKRLDNRSVIIIEFCETSETFDKFTMKVLYQNG